MNENVCFVDTETTGLDPERHEVWDIALIEADGTEHEWHVRPENFHAADEGALRVTHFYERVRAAGAHDETIEETYPRRAVTVKRQNFWTPQSRDEIAAEIGGRTANKHLVGAVPWFDARFLTNFLGREGYVPAWHYHMIDVETLAVGYLNGLDIEDRPALQEIALPWNSDSLSAALGIDSSTFGDRHTAIADARWAKAIYDRVMAA